LFARTTSAIAFQRVIAESRPSILKSGGRCGCWLTGMVLTYGVLALKGRSVPAWRMRPIRFSSR